MNMIFPQMAVQVLGGFGALLVTVLVLSSISSTLDSLLTGTATFLTEDIYHNMIDRKAESRKLTSVQRFIILGLGLLSIALAWFKVGTLGQILYFSGAFVCSMIWPIVYGLYDRKASAAAANWSMIVGTTAGVLTNLYISSFAGPIVAGFVSFVVFMIVSKAKPADFDWQQLRGTLDKA